MGLKCHAAYSQLADLRGGLRIEVRSRHRIGDVVTAMCLSRQMATS
jgi:hypothetical protein